MAVGIRVLYVDDEPNLLEIGRVFLERSGEFAVSTVTSAVSALDVLDRDDYDAIVSDYQMPQMDGIEFLKRVRAAGDSIPFILFTGRGREEVVIEALNEGADFYLQKGGDPRSQFAELAHKVHIAVENHRAAEKIRVLNRLYSVLSATNRAIVHLRTKSDFFSEICRILVEIGEFRMAWIGIADADQTRILPVASAGETDGFLGPIDISTENVQPGGGITGAAYREGRYLFSNDFSVDSQMEPWRENALGRGFKATAAFPFAVGAKNTGVLTLYAPGTGYFNEEIIVLLAELAIDISFAIKTIDEETDRKSAEDNIRRLERREADIINFLPDATFAINRTGQIIAWNRAIEEMTGVPAATMLGKGDFEYAIPFYGERKPILIDLINEPDEVIARRYSNVVRRKDTLIAFTSLTLPNEKQVELMVKTSPLYGNHDEIAGAIESIRDISDWKRAEKNLRESEGRFSAFMDHLPVTAFIKDEQFTTLFVNRNMKRLFGAGDWIGKSVWELFPADEAEVMAEDDRATLHDGYRLTTETLRTADGDERTFETSKFRIDREDRSPLIGGFAVDITERKRAENLIRESEARYRNIVEDQTEFICRFLPDGTHIFVNDAYCRYFGLDGDEVLGNRFRPHIPREDRGPLERFFRSLTPDHPVDTIEHRIVMPDGSTRWQRWSDRAIFDGSGTVTEYQSVGRDITEMRETLAALETSETRFRTQYQNNPQAIITWQHRDDDFVLIDINRAAEVLSEGRSHALLEKKLTELYATRPEIAQEVRRCYEDQTTISDDLVSENFLPGRHISITTAFVPPDLVMVHIDDITEKKRAEDALLQANHALELLSSITRHDINNQLTSQLGNLALLEQDEPALSSSEHFQSIRHAAERISAMIQFTQAYEEIGVREPVWHDCGTIIETVKHQVPLGGVELQNGLPAGSEVRADPMIVRVCYTLVENAVRHGGPVTTIRVFLEASGDEHLVVFEDDGDGIPADEKERIFERGFGRNNGFGLFLAREVLAISGITIRETGIPGRGARFEMTVPKGQYRDVAH